MKLERIMIYGTGFYKKGIKALYKRSYNGILEEEYFRKLFIELSRETHENIKVLGELKKCVFRIKNWKFREAEVTKESIKFL